MSLRRAVLSVSAVLALIPTVVYAHAAYKDSDPKDEAEVSSPPSSVWAEYTEPVQEGYLNIYDPCGARVDDGNTQVTGYRMTVGMSADRAGTYAVEWKAASAVDPHVTSGTFTFTVTNGEPCASDEEDPAPEGQAEQDEQDNDDGSRSTSDSSKGSTGDRARSETGRLDKPNMKDDAEMNGVRQPRDRSERSGDNSEQIELVQSAPTDDERGIWEGIPLGGFLLAMAVAAAIGAAGGRIYANIMGPRS